MQRFIENLLAELEGTILSFSGRVATWLAPAVPAILLARSSAMVFRLEGRTALVVSATIAISVELIGLEAVHAWARAKHWNYERDEVDDEPADERKAKSYIAYYLLVSEAFIGGFGLYLGFVHNWWWEMLGLLFPPFSYLAAQLMIERDTHHLRVLARQARLGAIIAEEERKRAERRERRAAVKEAENVSVKFTDRISDLELLSVFVDNPDMSLREAGRKLKVSHTTVKNRLVTLEAAGRIRRNGKGVEVI
jgi:hypothetical protein